MEEYISLIEDIIIETQLRIYMKIYLETSVINFLFAEDAPEKLRITKEFFSVIEEYEVFISDLVLLEIEQAPEQKRKLLLDVINKYKMKALESSEKIENLA